MKAAHLAGDVVCDGNLYKDTYTKITAAGESIEPDVFSPDSHYFFTYTIRGMEDATTNSTWHVTPFYKTLDGTVVTGTPGELPQN